MVDALEKCVGDQAISPVMMVVVVVVVVIVNGQCVTPTVWERLAE